MSETTTGRPAMSEAKQAAAILGLDVADLAVTLRRHAVSELEAQTTFVRNADQQPDFDRFERLLRAAEACEAAWDERLAAGEA